MEQSEFDILKEALEKVGLHTVERECDSYTYLFFFSYRKGLIDFVIYTDIMEVKRSVQHLQFDSEGRIII